MRVLITGGNGFLGSNVVKALIQTDHSLLVISRHCTALSTLRDRITFLHQTGGYNDHADAIGRFQPEYVIHFAWDGGNSHADAHSLRQFSINIPYGVELLEVLCALPVKPAFVGVGSFAEYGLLTQKAREQQPDAPVTFYGMSKSMFRTISSKVCLDNGMRWSWIRPCYIYGPGDVHTRLIPSVIRSLIHDKDVHLDSCNGIIDYLHIDDFSTAVLHLLKSDAQGIFNICSGNEYPLRQILTFIHQHTNSRGTVVFDDTLARSAASSYICGENTRLRDLGWTPTISIEDGLLRTIRVHPT